MKQLNSGSYLSLLETCSSRMQRYTRPFPCVKRGPALNQVYASLVNVHAAKKSNIATPKQIYVTAPLRCTLFLNTMLYPS